MVAYLNCFIQDVLRTKKKIKIVGWKAQVQARIRGFRAPTKKNKI